MTVDANDTIPENVDNPDTLNCCAVKLVTVVTPSVEIPVDFKLPLSILVRVAIPETKIFVESI